MADQGRCRGLAVGTRDRHDTGSLVLGRNVHGSREQLDIAQDFHTFGSGPINSPVRFGVGQWHARRQHEGRETAPVGGIQICENEAFSLGHVTRGGFVIPQRHLGPAGQQRPRRRQTRTGEAKDRDGLSGKGGDGDHDAVRCSLPKFQGGKADQGQHNRDDPEADDDSRFRPAQLLEMMMDRCHQENAASCAFEPGHLDDH